MCGRDSDGRHPCRGRGQRIADGPGCAGAAIAQADNHHIAVREHVGIFLRGDAPLLADPAATAPHPNGGALRAQPISPDIRHPVPRPPQHVDANANPFAAQRAGIRPRARNVRGERRGRVQYGAQHYHLLYFDEVCMLHATLSMQFGLLVITGRRLGARGAHTQLVLPWTAPSRHKAIWAASSRRPPLRRRSSPHSPPGPGTPNFASDPFA